MKKYKVKITETLTKCVMVEAGCPLDARDIAEEKWRIGEHYLGADDFQGVRFLVSESRGDGEFIPTLHEPDPSSF